MAVERKVMTAQDLLTLPDDGTRHELIDGELRTMSPGGGPYGNRGGWAHAHLAVHIGANDLGEVFGAETGFLLRRDPDRVRAPDFAFIRGDRLPAGGLDEGCVTVAPDLVVEVVSPGDSAADVRDKIADWLAFGCRAVWVIYPASRLDAYAPDGSARTYGQDDEVDAGAVLPGVRVRLGDLLRPIRRPG